MKCTRSSGSMPHKGHWLLTSYWLNLALLVCRSREIPKKTCSDSGCRRDILLYELDFTEMRNFFLSSDTSKTLLRTSEVYTKLSKRRARFM